MLFIVASLLGLTSALQWSDELTEDQLETANVVELFSDWQKAFDKSYETQDEERRRFLIFIDNLKEIATMNSAQYSFKTRANQFADLTSDEFRKYVHGEDGSCLKDKNGNKIFEDKVSETFVKISDISAPSSVDWEADGCVTPIKNQGQCGSCWAFASTGCIECNYCIKHQKLNSLSEQQLVDCTTSYGNYGCNGGWWYNSFDYVIKEGGLCSEEEYPYTARDGTCKQSSCGTQYDAITASVKVSPDSDTSLEDAVAEGCVAVGVEADQSSFQFYSSGVLTGLCGTSIDHGVLAVGYGTASDGTEYWKVKNSWGSSWGDAGYIYICKDCNKNGNEGECGINMYPYLVST